MDFSSDDEVSDSELFNVDDIDFSDIVVDDKVDEEVDFSRGIDAGLDANIDADTDDEMMDDDNSHEDLVKSLGEHLSRLPESKRILPDDGMWEDTQYLRRINDKVMQQSFLKLRSEIILLAKDLRGNPSNKLIRKIVKKLGKLINTTRTWVQQIPSIYKTQKFTSALLHSTRLMYDLVTVAEIKQDKVLEQIYGKGSFRYVSNWVKDYTEELEDIDEMAGNKKEMKVDELELRF